MIFFGKEEHIGNQRDVDQIIYPWLKLWTAVIDNMIQNAKAFEFTNKSKISTPSILTLLESFGHSQRHREQVEISRDRTVNVLGIPVGRKDGISLAPLRGLSVGNEDMFGPIAVNDKYSINWGFLTISTKYLTNLLKYHSKFPQCSWKPAGFHPSIGFPFDCRNFLAKPYSTMIERRTLCLVFVNFILILVLF
ncbi:hypothetical protein DINM_002482 [Dirofilaria immitis]|nr:hypothetical protein [Dirofilaria immitis]